VRSKSKRNRRGMPETYERGTYSAVPIAVNAYRFFPRETAIPFLQILKPPMQKETEEEGYRPSKSVNRDRLV